MSHSHNKSLLLVLLVALGNNVFGQTNAAGSNPINGKENNPYSKYGLGELRNGNNAPLRGMGNTSTAYTNPYLVNTDNPASYSFLQRTTFELGAIAATRTINGTINGVDQKYKTGTATLSYLSLAFPAGKNGGLSLGFRPYAHSYYSLVDTVHTNSTPSSPIGSAIKSYSGEGALNYAFIGASRKYKGLSIGINAGYLFGTYRNSASLIPIDTLSTNSAFNSQFSSNTRLGGIQWKGGLLYEVKLDSSLVLRIGASASMSQKIKQHYNELHLIYYNFTDTFTRDTSYFVGDQKGNLTLPLSYSVGIMLAKTGKWGFGIDYAATQWSSFNSELNPQMNQGLAKASYKISAGGEYTPDATNIRRYLSRATYRLGAYYGSDYLQIQNNNLPYYGITAGLSLPFKRSLSQIHMAVDAGVLGTTENNLIKQNYIRFTIGASLNDLWFVKRKYE